MRTAVLVVLLCAVLSGCDSSTTGPELHNAHDKPLASSGEYNESDKPSANQKVGEVMPFKLCRIANSHDFNGGYSLTSAEVKVEGGHSNDWAATGIAIAKKLGSMGLSTDIKVTVYRSDLGELDTKQTPDGYKWLAQVDFGVDALHSMGAENGGKQWHIMRATDTSVATPADIQMASDYQALNKKYNNPDNDDKIVAAIKKKYHVKGEWHIPYTNLMGGGSANRDDYFLDITKGSASLEALEKYRGLKNDIRSDVECST